jgi:hypothetical protein
MELLQDLTQDCVVKIGDLSVAGNALQRRFETFLARHQIAIESIRRTPAGFVVGPITEPAIKTQVDHLRAKSRRCHLLDVIALDRYGSCLLLSNTELCENRHLEDDPPLYAAFGHYSQVPALAEYLRNHVLGFAVQKRFGKEDLETHFRLFTAAVGLTESAPENLRVAGYYDRSYGYMVELYAVYSESAIAYFNLGPAHLIEAGHYLYQLGPDVFAQFSSRKVTRIDTRLMAIAFFRSCGCKSALRDLDRWQRAYDRC